MFVFVTLDQRLNVSLVHLTRHLPGDVLKTAIKTSLKLSPAAELLKACKSYRHFVLCVS